MKKSFFYALTLALATSFALTGCDELEELKQEVEAAADPEKQIEESAVLCVNNIIRQNAGSSPDVARCERVKLGEEIEPNKWRAKAYLENGNYFNCIIKLVGEDQIYVQLVP